MAVPYTFGSATTSIPLSQLDSNFATTITLGNTAIQLGNTVTTLNNMTLANVTITSGTSSFSSIANGTSNVTVNSSGGNITLGTAGTTAVTIDTSQNVGIGTSSLTYKLDVSVTGNNGIRTTSSAGQQLYLGNTGGDAVVGTLNNYSLGLLTNGGVRATIDSSGNVGIGVTPSATSSGKAVEIGTVGNTLWGIGAADLQISAGTYYNGANKYAVTGSAVSAYELAAGSHRWYYAASGTAGNTATFSESMRIEASGGNLLVGTTSLSPDCRTIIQSKNTSSSAYGLRVQDSGTNNMFYVRNDGEINTGLRATSPYNNGTINAPNLFVNTDGVLYRQTSSLKYKKNVQDATHGLADLMKLRSVTYEGKAERDAGKVIGGLIAEEVNDAGLTEFVQYAEDGSPDALAYANMVALCIKSIQELKAINDTQAETINALTARIVALEAK